MQIIKIKFCSWDKEYDFSNDNNLDLKIGGKVIVETEAGADMGEVIKMEEARDDYERRDDLKPITRLAGKDDLEKISGGDKAEMIKYGRILVKKHNLPMKIIDVYRSFDGSRLKFAFIADSRVDFRELVKDLARHYQMSVILHQVGIRDEAKICGDIGRCGVRPMCCRAFMADLGGISSEMAEIQQVAHRGSERLSGSCGRLMCCLRFENEGYAELAGKFPPLGAKVVYEGVGAEIIGWHTLKKTVDLKVKIQARNNEYERVFDIPLNKIKYKY